MLDITFPVEKGEKGPDAKVKEFVLRGIWEANDEEDLWNVITRQVGWFCTGDCERIPTESDSVAEEEEVEEEEEEEEEEEVCESKLVCVCIYIYF